MSKTTIVCLFILGVCLLGDGARQTHASQMQDFCPASGGLHSSWWTFYPTTRLCGTDYYTWNSVGTEDSYYHSGPHYLACGYQSWQNPGVVDVRVYIPSPDSKQTSNARYYRWNIHGDYVMIGSVDQYHSFGYVYLNSINWSSFDEFKLSDLTLRETQFTKHVDLDAFGFTCP